MGFSQLMQVFLLGLAFSVLGNSAEVKEENDVLVLDRSNFQDVVAEKDTLLVEFYAPWCGHCKNLEPHYAAAAKQLKAKNVALAKVDATIESGLAGDHGVEGYPTMKIFKKSLPGDSFDYEGPRDTEGIVRFMEIVSKPDWKPPFKLRGLHRLTKENLTEAFNKQEAWLIGFIDAESDGPLNLLSSTADLLKRGRESRAVAYLDAKDSSDAQLAEELSMPSQPPSFAVVRKGGKLAAKFGHSPTPDNLAKFYRAHSSDASPGGREFAGMAELDGVNDGLEPLLIGRFDSEEAGQFLSNFLIESGHFYNRRLEGGKIISEQLAKQLKLIINRIYLLLPAKLITDGESRLIIYEGGDASAELKRFFDRHSLPFIGYWSWNTKDNYRKASQPVCLFFLTVSFKGEQLPTTRKWQAKLAKLVNNYKGKVLFAMADDEDEEELVKSFKLDDSSADVNLGCYDSEKRRYAMPESDSFDANEVKEFLDKMLAGQLKPVIRSVTAKSAAAVGPVRELTGDTFDKLVLNDNKQHSLVLMCSLGNQPCSHSLKEFADAAVSNEAKQFGVQFAKLDTKLNDAPGNYYYRFDSEDLDMTSPQVMLGLVGKKERPILYEKDVVEKDYLINFLKENAKLDKTEL